MKAYLGFQSNDKQRVLFISSYLPPEQCYREDVAGVMPGGAMRKKKKINREKRSSFINVRGSVTGHSWTYAITGSTVWRRGSHVESDVSFLFRE